MMYSEEQKALEIEHDEISAGVALRRQKSIFRISLSTLTKIPTIIYNSHSLPKVSL